MKIMTFNVHSCLDLQKKNSVTRIGDLIKQEKPGLVGLNEIENFTPRTGFAHQLKRLAKAREMSCRFGPTLKIGPVGIFGNAVLSRYPIYQVSNEPLPGRFEKRCCLRTIIRLPDSFLTLMVTHLGLNYQERVQQIARLKELVQAEENQVVLMGDFNCAANEIALLSDILVDTGHIYSAGPTFPAHSPVHRIDYILASPGLVCTDARVVYSDASDHLPMIAEFAIEKP